jgi:hypothetical protein
MTDLPAEIECIKALCEANFSAFTNDDVSRLLSAYGHLQRVACLMLSYADGEISEGRAAELIGVDRVTLREMKIAALDRALQIVNREAAPRAANS